MSELTPEEQSLRQLWRDLAEANIELGADWPHIARTLFRDIDRLKRATADAEARLAAIEKPARSLAEHFAEQHRFWQWARSHPALEAWLAGDEDADLTGPGERTRWERG
jgi:hypothetical protein